LRHEPCNADQGQSIDFSKPETLKYSKHQSGAYLSEAWQVGQQSCPSTEPDMKLPGVEKAPQCGFSHHIERQVRWMLEAGYEYTNS
jgi:hypothetical protein